MPGWMAMPRIAILSVLAAAVLLAPAGPAAAANSGPRMAVDIGPGPVARSTLFEVTTLGPCATTGGLDLCFRARLEAWRGSRRLVSQALHRPSVFASYRAVVRWPCRAAGRVRWAVAITDTDTGRRARRSGLVAVPRCR